MDIKGEVRMTTKTYLGQIERLEKMIQNKLSEIYQLKSMACSISVSNDSDKVQKSTDKDKLGATVSKIVDLENEASDLVDNFFKKRKHIIDQIDSIEDTELYHVLSMRYVSKNTFEEISNKTNWSLRKIFSLHGKALQEFESRFGEEYLKSVH